MEFEWDPEKAEENLRSHGVAFTEAQTVFADPLILSKSRFQIPTTQMGSSDS